MSESSAFKHKDFNVESSGPRKKMVRQDRMTFQSGKCLITLNNLNLEVLNVSSFGLAALVRDQDKQAFEKIDGDISDVPLSFNNVETQRLHLRKVRVDLLTNSANNEAFAAYEVVGEPIQIDRLKALDVASEVINGQSNYWLGLSEIPNEFKNVVFEMRDWLLRLKAHIDRIEEIAPVDNAADRQDFRETIAEHIADYLGSVIPANYTKIPSFLSKLEPKTRTTAVNFAREQLGSLIYGAPFAHRAFHKPRGYAGDFEMMNHLYRDELVGKTLYDQCIHRYFIDEPAGQAVKNRGFYLKDHLKELLSKSNSPLKVMSIASGPAMEVQLLLKEIGDLRGKKVQFHFVDQDEESLKHAQRQIQSSDRFVQSGFEFFFHNLAIKNILVKGLPDKDLDLVYSAGLFDYFADPVATAAATRMFEGLKSGGRCIIGNFSTKNPCVPFMELVLDWHLIYRTVEDMNRIFQPVTKNVKVEQEPLGINLFAILNK